MTGRRTYVACARCGKYVSLRVAGGSVAHKCPHARTCIAPAPSRERPSCNDCAMVYPQAHAPRPRLVEPSEGGAA